MKTIVSILLGILTIGSAQAPFAVLNQINLQEIGEEIRPDHIIALSLKEFVLLDRTSNELILLEGTQIKNRTGGFGISTTAFADPVDMVGHNLQIRVVDRIDNSIKRFDHKLNFLNEEFLNVSEYNPFYPDLLAIDPLKGEMVLSTEFGVLLDMTDLSMPLIELDQYSISGKCIEDISSDPEGNLALLICDNELILFNRFGRFLQKLALDISEPLIILSYLNEWMILNKKGEVVTHTGRNKQIPLNNGEIIISADTRFQQLILLTDQRIIVLE